MADTESEWLVKSGGRILGPFLKSRISELLRTREITLLDEVSSPLRRWITLQNHEGFRDVVEAYRNANVSDKTELTWTSDGSVTQTGTDLGAMDRTQEINADLSGFSSGRKEIVIHDIQEQSRNATGGGGGRYQPANSGVGVQNQVDKTTRGLWILTVLVLLAVVAYISLKRSAQKIERPSAGDLRSRVVSLMQIGHHEEALREMKSEIKDVSQAGDLSVYMGALLIQLDGQTLLGRRALEAVIAEKRSETKLAQTSLGIADLLDRQLDSAKLNFEAALTHDSEFAPALINLGTLQLIRGDFKRAMVTAQRVLRQNPRQGEAVLLLADAQVQLMKNHSEAKDAGGIRNTVKKFYKENWDYSSEVGLYHLYFSFIAKEKNLTELVKSYLDRDPELTNHHRHNVFIFQERMRWRNLAPLCEEIARGSQDPVITTFLASCFMRAERMEEAQSMIGKAVTQSPKDPLFQGWHSLILKNSREAEQASVILGRAVELNRRGEYTLPSLLQARFCQSKEDVDCSHMVWQRLVEKNSENLSAMAGLAWVYVQERSFKEASDWISKGLKESADYIPLLELRHKGETEGWYED